MIIKWVIINRKPFFAPSFDNFWGKGERKEKRENKGKVGVLSHWREQESRTVREAFWTQNMHI